MSKLDDVLEEELEVAELRRTHPGVRPVIVRSPNGKRYILLPDPRVRKPKGSGNGGSSDEDPQQNPDQRKRRAPPAHAPAPPENFPEGGLKI